MAVPFPKLYSKLRSLRGRRLPVKKTSKRLGKIAMKKMRAARRRLTGGMVSGPRTVADNIRFFANPGPQFENQESLDASLLPSRAKTIAFYLPQFHAFEENDQWWGEGFTEWRNVARGTPRFKGHYQPRVPRDLGFYDLNNIETIEAQCNLAKHNGVDAFCFYYYWFNGKRLMEKPLDLLVNSDIDQDFCIMWANENWTRTWDGLENDVLIEQNYLDEDEDAFIADTAAYMADSRYVRMDGRLLFILYRPGLLPSAKSTIDRWRGKWNAVLGETPLVMMVQGFGDEDPREFGLDGAVEFPPHKVCANIKNINDRCQIIDSNYHGLVRDYNDVIDASLNEPAPEFQLIKTVSPHWDNDARREGMGMTIHGSTPALYEKWLNGAIQFSLDNPVENESVVFVNAWNEWAEGAYLEPDVHFGHAYLNATKRAVKGLASDKGLNRILLVGHDAHMHGAQMLLLNIAKIYKAQFGMDVVIALKDGGPLLPEYKKITQTVVLNKLSKQALSKWIGRQNITAAICNTTVTGDLVPLIRSAGIQTVSLIHEMPNLIKDYKLEGHIKSIASHANHVVFAADKVQSGFGQFTDSITANQIINPQGTYFPIEFDVQKRDDIRASLGIAATDKVVLGVGYADLRKGFDLFMETARRTVSERSDVHFVWAGALAGDMKLWFQSDFSEQEETVQANAKHIHIIGFTDKVSDYYSAADALYLPSREDPYPTVVLEAMDVGMPVVLYRGATGFDSLMETYGYSVPMGDVSALDQAINSALSESDSNLKFQRMAYVDEHCRFDSYCFSLLKMLHPTLKKVSVAVPSYNYEEYMEQRLNSVFAQNYPIFETLLLDDCSSDNSVSVAQHYTLQSDRSLSIIKNEQNSGNVFNQWQTAASVSRGDLLWIAEADDSANAKFLSTLVETMDASTGFAFSDSSQMGVAGEHLAKSYQHYYSSVHESLFSEDFTMDGADFSEQAMFVRNAVLNVSSVLWNKEKLNKALETISVELNDYQLVGDWLLYLTCLNQSKTTVSFVREPLNVHRRHDSSVTHDLSKQNHLDEISSVHQTILNTMTVSEELEAAMGAYVEELRVQFGLEVDSESLPSKRKVA